MPTNPIDAARPLFADHPTFNTQKAWVVLWSKAQGHLHIETLDEMLMSHIQAFVSDQELQYVPLLIGDREVVEKFAEEITPKVAERYNAKHSGEDGFIPYEALR